MQEFRVRAPSQVATLLSPLTVSRGLAEHNITVT